MYIVMVHGMMLNSFCSYISSFLTSRIGLRRGRMGSGGDGAEWRGALEIEEGVMRRTHSVDQLAASGGGQGGSALFPAVSLSSNRYRFESQPWPYTFYDLQPACMRGYAQIFLHKKLRASTVFFEII